MHVHTSLCAICYSCSVLLCKQAGMRSTLIFHLQDKLLLGSCCLQGVRRPALPDYMHVKRAFAVHECGKAIIATALRQQTGRMEHVERVSIIPRGRCGTHQLAFCALLPQPGCTAVLPPLKPCTTECSNTCLHEALMTLLACAFHCAALYVLCSPCVPAAQCAQFVVLKIHTGLTVSHDNSQHACRYAICAMR